MNILPGNYWLKFNGKIEYRSAESEYITRRGCIEEQRAEYTLDVSDRKVTLSSRKDLTLTRLVEDFNAGETSAILQEL